MEINWTIIISVGTSFFPIIWVIYQYFDTKNRELKWKEFEVYHKLIKELVQPEEMNSGVRVLYLDRQTAIIFELRNFKRYYPLSYRTLISLKEKWGGQDQFPRLIDEINYTIGYLKKKRKVKNDNKLL